MKQFAYFAPKIRGNQMYYQPLCWPYLTKPLHPPLPHRPPIFSVQLKKKLTCAILAIVYIKNLIISFSTQTMNPILFVSYIRSTIFPGNKGT